MFFLPIQFHFIFFYISLIDLNFVVSGFHYQELYQRLFKYTIIGVILKNMQLTYKRLYSNYLKNL